MIIMCEDFWNTELSFSFFKKQKIIMHHLVLCKSEMHTRVCGETIHRQEMEKSAFLQEPIYW